MKIIGALLFSLIAAIGNALFAAGQKKAFEVENGLTFVMYSAIIAALLAFITAPVLGTPLFIATLKSNWNWIVISGAGLFLTYIGFYFLYSHYGVSQYILYAVLSIFTTSIIVGVIFFKEPFNSFHWAALIFSIITVILFSIGQSKVQGHL